MRKALIVAALLLTPAGAQTLSVNISASVPYPQILQTAANVAQLLSQGVQVSFLTPGSQPAATLSTSGSLVVNPASPDGTRLTQVQVTTPTPSGPIREIYPLAQPLTVGQNVQPQSIVVRGQDGTARPLTSVMGRQAAWAKAPGLQKKPGGMPPGQYKKTQGNKK